ncbi:MAG: hypothetical protein ACLQSR_07615 [Limisphaerales bacterium]
MNMYTQWFYTVPGSLVITAILVWPFSRQDSENWFERIRFCVLSMMGVAFLVWGCQEDLAKSVGWLTITGPVIAMMAGIFLVMLWLEKFTSLLTDLLLGCFIYSSDCPWDPEMETKQIESAIEHFRKGERRGALRLCRQIIESHSQFMSTARTLAFWIEHPGGLRLIQPPRVEIKFHPEQNKNDPETSCQSSEPMAFHRVELKRGELHLPPGSSFISVRLEPENGGQHTHLDVYIARRDRDRLQAGRYRIILTENHLPCPPADKFRQGGL